MKDFNSPGESFSELAADNAAKLIAVANDITLVISADGVINDIAIYAEELKGEDFKDWIGKKWVDVVSVESIPKIESLLAAKLENSENRWRQINHPTESAGDLPVQYVTMPLDKKGSMVAVGRYLGSIASLQQQLLNAQQSMERHYWQFRHLETRYRLLFKLSAEAVFIIDSQNQNILEANPYAHTFLEKEEGELAGLNFSKLFTKSSVQEVDKLLADVRATGKLANGKVNLTNNKSDINISISLFPQNGSSLYLIRLSPLSSAAELGASVNPREKLLTLVENAPDGFVVTDANGEVIAANKAFLELAELFTEEQVKGESLSKWLGRPGVDLNVLTANLREQGKVRMFATSLRGEYGSSIQVEISAASLTHEDQQYFAFIIRDIGLRLDTQVSRDNKMPRPVQQLTELVGRVPLKELVQESTDMIERYCIEAALEITGDNRASAAEMLGLSRQSLYTKLRRYGLGDLAPEGGD